MNNIKVPDAYKHMVRKTRGEYGSREYQEATLRDYIQAHPDEVLTIADFQKAMGGNTTTGPMIKRLIKSGHIIRTQKNTGQRGHAYTYRWVNKRSIPDSPKYGKLEAIHTTPRKVYATKHERGRLDEWFLDFCNTAEPEAIVGANTLRKFVNDKVSGEEES